MEKETWSNATRSTIWILTYDPRNQLRSERVRPDGKVSVTVEERHINSDRATSEEVDVFKNG